MSLLNKKEFKVKLVSIDEAKALSNRDYNPTIWEKTIDGYTKYKDVIFYTIDGSIYDTDLYVIYTVDTGLRFRQQVSYSSCLSSSGLTQGSILENNVCEFHLSNDDGKSIVYKKDSRTRSILANVCKENPFSFFF